MPPSEKSVSEYSGHTEYSDDETRVPWKDSTRSWAKTSNAWARWKSSATPNNTRSWEMASDTAGPWEPWESNDSCNWESKDFWQSKPDSWEAWDWDDSCNWESKDSWQSKPDSWEAWEWDDRWESKPADSAKLVELAACKEADTDLQVKSESDKTGATSSVPTFRGGKSGTKRTKPTSHDIPLKPATRVKCETKSTSRKSAQSKSNDIGTKPTKPTKPTAPPSGSQPGESTSQSERTTSRSPRRAKNTEHDSVAGSHEQNEKELFDLRVQVAKLRNETWECNQNMCTRTFRVTILTSHNEVTLVLNRLLTNPTNPEEVSGNVLVVCCSLCAKSSHCFYFLFRDARAGSSHCCERASKAGSG